MDAAAKGFGVLIALCGLCCGAEAAEPPPIGDERAILDHVDIAAIHGGTLPLAVLIARGKELFEARFTVDDGAGRPGATQAIVPTPRSPEGRAMFQRTGGLDANSCAGCHAQPSTGGAGDFVANVFVSEGFSDAEFDSLDPQFSNERGTPPLSGDGLIELVAREMTAELRGQRASAARAARAESRPVRTELTTKGVGFGFLTVAPDGLVDVREIDGVDHDLVVRPFSQKGVFVSLRQFTVNAMNMHHGMQATERFGPRWTDTDDFDRDGHADELTEGDISALVAFQATLQPPSVMQSEFETHRQAARRGEALFAEIGCASCHIPALPLESTVFADPGPHDMAGTLAEASAAAVHEFDLADLPWAAGLQRDETGRVLVPFYSDLKRHRIADPQNDFFANEILGQRFVARDEFLTARLWGVADTAPYGHRGDVTTLREAILHHGGEAADSRGAFAALTEPDRRAIVEFLKTLRLPANTMP